MKSMTEMKEAVQERILVIGSQQTSVKTMVIMGLACFILGGAIGIRLDLSGFAAFKEKARAIQERQRSMNRALIEELNAMRAALEAERARRRPSDSAFEDAISQPGPEHCLVPTADLNPIIVEASR